MQKEGLKFPLDPCGLAVDFGRRKEAFWCVPWKGTTTRFRVRFYPVPDDTPCLPVPHIFGNPLWRRDSDHTPEEDSPGTIDGTPMRRPFHPAGIAWRAGPDGKPHFCGDPRAWLEGAQFGVDQGLEWPGGWGVSTCCLLGGDVLERVMGAESYYARWGPGGVGLVNAALQDRVDLLRTLAHLPIHFLGEVYFGDAPPDFQARVSTARTTNTAQWVLRMLSGSLTGYGDLYLRLEQDLSFRRLTLYAEPVLGPAAEYHVENGATLVNELGADVRGRLVYGLPSAADLAEALPVPGKVLAFGLVATAESTSSTTPVNLTTPDEVTFTADPSRSYLVEFSAGVKVTGALGTAVETLYLDGADAGQPPEGARCPALSQPFRSAGNWILAGLSAGSHTVQIRHFTTGGTMEWNRRALKVSLLP